MVDISDQAVYEAQQHMVIEGWYVDPDVVREALEAAVPYIGREDDDLIIMCDSLLSLCRYRESLSQQTKADIDALMGRLRKRSDQSIANRRTAERKGGAS